MILCFAGVLLQRPITRRAAAQVGWHASPQPAVMVARPAQLGSVSSELSVSQQSSSPPVIHAGRDGLPARCLLLYRFADVLRLAAMGNQEHNWQSNLMSMAAYATAHECRRKMLCRYATCMMSWFMKGTAVRSTPRFMWTACDPFVGTSARRQHLAEAPAAHVPGLSKRLSLRCET